MGQEEASRVVVLFQMQPIFILVLSLIFLNEIITPRQLLGFGLILGAAVAISLNKETSRLKLSRAFFLILLTDLIWSSSVVLFKATVVDVNFFDIFAYESWGLALGGFILYLLVPSLRNAFHRNIKVVSRRGLLLLAYNESSFVVSKLVAFTAVLLGPVALVSVLGSTQVFIGIVLGAVLTRIIPRVFQENISRDVLVRKGLLAVVMFGGILLVS
jgi:drug/metabolite transporter (DMT)-like permease